MVCMFSEQGGTITRNFVGNEAAAGHDWGIAAPEDATHGAILTIRLKAYPDASL